MPSGWTKFAHAVLAEVPGRRVASDQAYRDADLAIDFCEDVPPLPQEAVDRIAAIFERFGATAKISSIHVNGWFGSYDKLSTTRCSSARYSASTSTGNGGGRVLRRQSQ